MPDPQPPRQTRREVLKKAAYVAPAVMTLSVTPAFAQTGSLAASSLASQSSTDKSRTGRSAKVQGFPKLSSIKLPKLKIRTRRKSS